ncbi:hypothetical protein ACWIUD_04710 [Helicobacter sp. 23-1044]
MLLDSANLPRKLHPIFSRKKVETQITTFDKQKCDCSLCVILKIFLYEVLILKR